MAVRKYLVFVFVLLLMGVLSFVNLLFTNAFGETCGILHPLIFQIDVSQINTDTGSKSIAISDPSIPYESTSTEMDTLLRVYNAQGGLLAYNDDFSFEDRSSAIEGFPIGQYGSLIIEVGTYGDFDTGRYQLTVEEGEPAAPISPPVESTEEAPIPFNVTLDGTSYTEPVAINGSLQAAERVFYSLSAEQALDIRVEGVNDFDTYLRVLDANGDVIAENDDYDTSLGYGSALLGFSPEAYESVTLQIAHYSDTLGGSYTLSIAPASGEGTNLRVDGAPYNAPLEGQFIAEEVVSYSVSAEQPINIQLNGEDGLDTYLRIYNEAGEVIAENDDYNSLNAAIFNFPIQDYGTVLIELSLFDPTMEGAYSLILSAADGTIPDPYASYETGLPLRLVETNESLSAGQSREGVIRNSQRVHYQIQGSGDPNQTVNIRLGTAKESGWNWIPVRLFGDNYTAMGWPSCLEYYGYQSGGTYRLNLNGFAQYGQGIECTFGAADCEVLTRIKLSFIGQVLMYLITPGLVILLPIAAVYSVRSSRRGHGAWRSFQWILMLSLVALHVLTTSLLYVHLATVSGIEALANFAYGILAGAATGSAIAFMDRVLDVFGDRDDDEPDA